MLPTYSSHEQEKEREKMHRHTYSNGQNSYPNGGGRAPATFHIAPHRFQPRSQPAYRRRKLLCTRTGIVFGLFFTLLFIVFPSTRPSFLSSFSLFHPEEDFHLETVRYYDLSKSQGTAEGWKKEERVLLCAPLRDAASHLPMFFGHLRNLTYPHNLIDLAFLVGDSKDDTLSLLSDLLKQLQAQEDPLMRYGEISIIEKNFGQKVKQDVESRHGFAAQASRRKSMAQARNWLLSAALRPTHSWVYWRDVDVETAPFSILEDLMRHNRDVIVPNVWRPLPEWLGGEQPYDLNSWQESETALALADTLDEDAVIVEGYAEYATWRPHLAYLRDPFGDPDMEMEIDGVGGVSILAKASVFRSGVHFPAFSFEKHAETEGFGKMAKRMKYSVIGLPHYTIWHLYEPSVDDIRHMEEMEETRRQRVKADALKQEQNLKLQQQQPQQPQTPPQGAEAPKQQPEAANKPIEEKKYKEHRKESHAQAEAKGQEHIYGEDGKARLNQPFHRPEEDALVADAAKAQAGAQPNAAVVDNTVHPPPAAAQNEPAHAL